MEKTLSSRLQKNNLYIIAEIGVNHEGDINQAKKMVLAAKKGGAHAAKFQSYKAEKIAAEDSPAYWDLEKEKTKSQFELFKKYDSFGQDEYKELAKYCQEVGIDFMSTPFDLEAAKFLNELQSIIKIASADITNFPLLREVASYNKPVILSTGCSKLEEIKMAVKELENHGASEIALLHCILNYPTLDNNANLSMINSLRSEFPNHIIGYSDHTLPDDSMSILNYAVVLGAKVIEKHFTLDKTLPGNDHYHSMDQNNLEVFSESSKRTMKILGIKSKQPLDSELKSIKFARRSLYYNKALKIGDTIKESDLICLRPGTGISPIEIDNVIGKIIIRETSQNTQVNAKDFK